MNRGSIAYASRLATLLVLIVMAACAPPAAEAPASDPAEDAAALRSLLDDFLANAGAASAHERFWADDLIYTSSRGTRTTKAEILAGMAPAESGTEPASAAEAGPIYRAEDVDVRLYGTTAVVAFRLVIEPTAGSGDEPSFNFNTGTFLKRDGEWRAVAWQSTVGVP